MDAKPSVPNPAAEVIRSLKTWPDGELWTLGRAVGCELDRRRLPVPAALPVLEALASLVEMAPA